MEKTDILRKLYKGSLAELCEYTGKAEYSGIFSPVYSESEITRFMSDHYKTEEGVQSQNFELYDFYEGLIARAMDLIGADMQGKYTILELGAGFGSATIPILKLFPNAHLVATELSLPMLARLKQGIEISGYSARCHLLQLNAEESDFESNSFDFIIGAAILHHLFHPEKVFEHAYRILKPGGYAVFFEPFAEGYSILGDFYKIILEESGFSADNRSILSRAINKLKLLFNLNMNRIDKSLVNYFYNSVFVWDKMKSTDKSGPFFENADDKWLFTKDYFRGIAEKNGFDDCRFFGATTFSEVFRTHTAGNTQMPIPEWIIQKFNAIEQDFPAREKEENFTEGCVIVKK